MRVIGRNATDSPKMSRHREFHFDPFIDSYQWFLFFFFSIFIDFTTNELSRYYYRYWLAPIGKSLGIKSAKAKPPVPNKSLEDVYTKSSKLNHKTVSVLSCPPSTYVRSIIGTSFNDFSFQYCAIFLRLVFALRLRHSSLRIAGREKKCFVE